MPISSSEENNQLLEAQNLPIDRKLFQNSKKKKNIQNCPFNRGCPLNTVSA